MKFTFIFPKTLFIQFEFEGQRPAVVQRSSLLLPFRYLLKVIDQNLKTQSGESNKYNQCDFASSRAGHLRTNFKTHSEDKSKKCNQCNYASLWAIDLRKHLEKHSGEKSNKCNQCDSASSRAGHLRTHLKTHSGKNLINATNVIMPPFRQSI